LSTFTFRQVGVRPIEFQALPGPEARALRAKTMRRVSSLRPGGQFKCGMSIAECGMEKGSENSEFHIPNSELGNARWARLILRKHGAISESISFPADAFSAQRPCFRATSLLFSRKGNRKSEDGQSGHPFFPRLIKSFSCWSNRWSLCLIFFFATAGG